MASVDEALSIALDLQLAGRLDEAWELYGRILAAVPDEANALHLSGLVAAQRGREDDARGRLRRALALLPAAAGIHLNLAKLERAAGRAVATAAGFARTLRLAPAATEAAAALAVLSQEAGRTDRAGRLFRHLAVLQPDLAEPWLRRATLPGTPPAEALPLLRRAVHLRPDNAAAWRRLAAALRATGADTAAATAFERTLALDPADTAALSSRASTLRDLGRFAAALTGHGRADRLAGGWGKGGAADVRYNHALALLLAGDLPRGFAAYEARWQASGFPTPPRGLPQPLWRGEPLAGRTLLLHEEQGRGDAIQFVRYAPLAAAMGGRVLLEVGADLAPLMRTLPGVERVLVRGEALPPFDLHCPLLSLPLAFGTTLDSVPAAVPYLAAEPQRAAGWRARLAGSGKGEEPAVGLVWGGNPAFAGDAARSPGLARLLPLLAVPGVRFFALQPGLTGPLPPGLTDLGPEIGDFADTAAIMAGLDLVISSCTAPAHLAGALGRPVWVLLAHAPDWRWLLDRGDSPWYPTARLFRQPRPGDWASVAAAVAEALGAFAEKQAGGAAEKQ